jgi:hypothetical protein
MLTLIKVIFDLLADLFRSRVALQAEIPPFMPTDKLMLGWVYRVFPNACDALAIVRPETVVRGIGRAFELIGAGSRVAGRDVRLCQRRSAG